MNEKALLAKLHALAKGLRDLIDPDPSDPYEDGRQDMLRECWHKLRDILATANDTPQEGQSVEQRAPRESECTQHAADYFYRQGYAAALSAQAPSEAVAEPFTHQIHCPQFNRPCNCKRNAAPQARGVGHG
jgi:hypothetical protein